MRLKDMLTNNAFVQLLARIYKHFDTVPHGIKVEHYSFYIISNIGYTVGWLIHAIWLFIFLGIGQYTMMYIQVFSIACHVVAIIINRRGYFQPAMMMGMLEVIGHQVLAVYLLGWGAGFQYIIPAISLFPFLKHDGSVVLKIFLLLCGMASFLGLEIFLKDKVPVYELSDGARIFFSYSNIISSFLFTATWGVFITLAASRTQEVINKKIREVFVAEKATEHAELQRKIEVKERDAEIYRLRNVELKASNEAILMKNKIIEQEKKRSDDLLLNILPSEVAEELKDKGSAAARYFEHVTVMFTDFVNFTSVSEQMSPQQLIDELDCCFKAFDGIIGKYNIEKIKTIGDAYLAVTGLPKADPFHATEIVAAALEISAFMHERGQTMREKTFEVRIGIHSGSVVAGIVGVKKFAYDIWGDTVNVAARMEQNSEAGKINISGATYELVKDNFECEYRGKMHVKNKGDMDMYFVNGRKS
jgi:class 3 adenylate cyclase